MEKKMTSAPISSLKKFKLEETPLFGVFVIHHQSFLDSRGELQRIFDNRKLAEIMPTPFVQHSLLSKNPLEGTLRGFHYQIAPFSEDKIFTVVRGRIFDVVADVRLDSPTYGKTYTVRLDEFESHSLLVPRGCANAWVTEKAHTWIHYYISNEFSPESSRGFRYDDDFFQVQWPTPPVSVSTGDLAWKPFRPQVDGVTL
jgi:dTDP-4-dehydrorhamnose 3,5-epimerase